MNQTGPLTAGGGSIVGKLRIPGVNLLRSLTSPAFEKLPQNLRNNLSTQTLSDLARFPPDWPEYELLPLGAAATETNDTANYISINLAILTTTSRGNVTLQSPDANDNPIISPNWLSTKTDQELSVQAFRRARQIAASTGIIVGSEVSPGPDVQSDSEILDFIKEIVAPIHHAAATCTMGKPSDPNAVVDSHGRVFGVRGLRIVDASAFALLPPGHAQSNVCK